LTVKKEDPTFAAVVPPTPEDLAPPDKKLGQKLMFHEGGIWAIMNAVVATTGIVMTAFALNLQADAFIFGLLGALPLFAAVTQLWTPQMVALIGSRKRVSVLTLGIARLSLFPLALLAVFGWLFPAQNGLWLIIFLVIITVYSALTAIGGTAWQSWSGTVVPIEKRASYFANRSIYIGALGLVTTFLAGVFLDWWRVPNDGKQVQPLAIVILFLVAASVAVITIFLLRKTPDLPDKKLDRTARPRVLATLKETWDYVPMRRYLIYRAINLFAVFMVVPYYNVYLLQNLKMSFTEVSILTNVGTLASLLSLPLWGKLVERYGCSRVLFWTSIAKVFYVAAWAFVLPGNPFIPMLLIHITLVIDAGQALSATNLLMNLMPRQDASNVGHFSVFTATTNLFSALGPFIAGILIGLIGTQQWVVLGIGFGAIQLMFLLSALVRLLSMAVFSGFDDKQKVG
jgi:MFS family permease